MIRTFIAFIAPATRALLCCAALLSAPAFAAVDANQASQAELESIKGIGPGLAGKILAARQSGNFKDWNDLAERVKGVGPGNAARFSQAGMTVGGAAFENRAAGAQASKPSNAANKAENKADDKAERAAARAAKRAAQMEQGAAPTPTRKATKTEAAPA